jgi:ribosome-binding factor A
MSRKNSNRLERIDEEIKRELSHIITYEVSNSNVTGMVSVTKVHITPDLKYAKVYVSMLGSKSVEKTLEGLKSSSGFMRTKLAQTLNLRVTPELSFVYDDSAEKGEKIDRILNQIKADDEKFRKEHPKKGEEN